MPVRWIDGRGLGLVVKEAQVVLIWRLMLGLRPNVKTRSFCAPAFLRTTIARDMNAPQVIKNQLKEWLTAHRGHGQSDVFIEELCIVDKSNRADLVHANGALLGFEIKSANDTLTRWESQCAAYAQIFDEVWLCCHARHVQRAYELSAQYVGLMAVDDHGGLIVLRAAKQNKRIDVHAIAGLLWRSEIDELLNRHGLPVNRREKIGDARERCCANLSATDIKAEVLLRLKQRYRGYGSSSAESLTAPGVNPPLSI